jgi:hypothetical protein
MKVLVIILGLFALLPGCKDNDGPIWSNTPCGKIDVRWTENPNQAMEIGFTNDNLLFDKLQLDKSKMTLEFIRSYGYRDKLIYYYIDGVKRYVEYVFFNVSDTALDNTKYSIATGEIMPFSWGAQQQKQYFIDWPNGTRDTLFVDYYEDNTRNNPCCCQYPLRSMTLNGKGFKQKTDTYKNGIYLFE